MGIRIGIREQLAALGLLAVLVGIAVIAIPTWMFVHGFVSDVKTEGLAETASLKAAELASHLVLLQSTTSSISTRLIVQQALVSYRNGNSSEDQVQLAVETFQTALLTSGFIDLLQGQVFASDQYGNVVSLFNTTKDAMRDIPLPELYPNGSHVLLGDDPLGFPPTLYPNLTYPAQDFAPNGTIDPSVNDAEAFPGVSVGIYEPLLLGPLILNESYALISFSQPVLSVDGSGKILGYITVLAAATSLFRIQLSPEGLGNSGETLVLGPTTPWNRFQNERNIANGTTPGNLTALDATSVRFVLPPLTLDGEEPRHTNQTSMGQPFQMQESPAAVRAFALNDWSVNNASALLDTHNEAGIEVAVGWARPPTTLVDWVVMVEQSHAEAFAPIFQLRKIIIGCVFGTIAFVLVCILPCAHYSVRPIRRLKEATEAATVPPGFKEDLEMQVDDDEKSPREPAPKPVHVLRWISAHLRRPTSLMPKTAPQVPKHHAFRIPARVSDRKHFVKDELTELTSTFNEMSDELYVQYTHLEEKVAERTKELELSKKAAEAANESKTLFLANISHELKTPLNGILGLCATCMEDNDLGSVRRELKTMYESGNLLLRLLDDLLAFSRNQVNRQMALEEEEFQLEEIGNQIKAIFGKSARERDITLNVRYTDLTAVEGIGAKLENGLERKQATLKDLRLVADQHRILQVLLNLVNNSLKFTGEGGAVDIQIRCLGFAQHGTGLGTGATDDAGLIPRQSSTSPSRSPSKRSHRLSGLMSGRASLENGTGTGRSPASLRRQIFEKSTTNESTTPIGSSTTAAEQSCENLSRCGDSVRSATTEARPWLFEFVVQDNGVGIPENLQNKVFEPFVQGDTRLSKRTGGAGLGLAICQQLATVMGGSISLSSEPGVGTSVCLHVPLRVVPAPSPSGVDAAPAELTVPPAVVKAAAPREISLPLPPPPQEIFDRGRSRLAGGSPTPIHEMDEHSSPLPTPTPTPDGTKTHINPLDAPDLQYRRLRVLVVEDNEVNVNVVTKMLKLEKVQNVTVARDGQEALDVVTERIENDGGFDVILMDILMPRLDGLQSTERIRQLGFKSPIVALTASAEGDIVPKGIAVGMSSFLGKPIRRPALKKVLMETVTLMAKDRAPGVSA